MSVNPGKRFEGWLKDSLEAAGMFVLRIPDKVYNVGGRIKSDKTPADFLAARGGDGLHCYLIECKATSQRRLSFSQLEQHQHDALVSFDSIHGNARGYVAVNYYDNVNVKRKNLCFMVPVAVWDEYASGAMKSLSEDECLSDPRICLCPRAQGGVYDMGRLMEQEGR